MIACPTCGEVYPETDCNVHVCSRSAAQEWQLRVAAAQAGDSDVCGSESLHCATAKRLRERVRELEEKNEALETACAMLRDGAGQRMEKARADKAEAERDEYRDAVKLALTHIRAMTPSTQHPAMVRAVQALKTALKEATDGQ